MFPALAARRKLVLLSDWRDADRKVVYVSNRDTSMFIILVFLRFEISYGVSGKAGIRIKVTVRVCLRTFSVFYLII